MPSSHQSADHATDSRRTRKAVSALDRVAGQRAELATAYASASDSRDRLYAAAAAVRAATGDLAARQTPPRLQARADARLNALAAELWDAQQATASRLLTAEQTRATENHARNGRRARHDGRPTTHPKPERPGAPT